LYESIAETTALRGSRLAGVRALNPLFSSCSKNVSAAVGQPGGWHAFRRGVATNLNRLLVPDKIIQRVLRHSDFAVTQEAYVKPEDRDSKAAMEILETALAATQNARPANQGRDVVR